MEIMIEWSDFLKLAFKMLFQKVINFICHKQSHNEIQAFGGENKAACIFHLSEVIGCFNSAL